MSEAVMSQAEGLQIKQENRMRKALVFALGLTSLGVLAKTVSAEPADIARCASRDLRLLMSIEAHGEAQDVPSDKLGAAFFTMMKARAACDSGRFDEAFAIYDGIVVVPAQTPEEMKQAPVDRK
jgi:hypothetical protein